MPRKIQAPTINDEVFFRKADNLLQPWQDALDGFRLEIEVLQREWLEGEISVEALCLQTVLYVSALFDEGFDNETIMRRFPIEEFKDEVVELPRAVVMHLADAIYRYNEGGAGVTLGEAFRMEGSRNPHAKSRIKTVKKHWALSQQVVSRYVYRASIDDPVTLEEAIRQISVETGESEETIKRAYRRFGRDEVKLHTASGLYHPPKK